MSATAYIWHVILETDRRQRALRSAEDDAVLAIVARQLTEARSVGRAAIGDLMTLVPGPSIGTALWCEIEARAVLGTVALIAVAPTSQVSGRLWAALREPVPGVASAQGEPPASPWVALRLYGAATLLPAETVDLIGGLSASLGWVWIEGQP